MSEVLWSSRADAGLVEPVEVLRAIAPSAGVAGHWGGAGPFRFVDHADCLAEWAGWQAWHMSAQNHNDYVDIAYNVGACWHRYLLEGRSTRADPIVRGGANGNRAVNGDRYSIVALWGSEDEGEPPADLLITVRAGIDFLRDEAGAGNGLAPHRDLSSTSCPGDVFAAWLEAGAPLPAGAAPGGLVRLPVVIDLGDWSPRPVAAQLDGMSLTVELEADVDTNPEPQPDPDPDPDPKPDPEPEEDPVPTRPRDDQFEPGTSHASFTAMGERLLVWLDDDEISHDGDGYQPGPTYSEFDDFNVRKVQSKMGNAVDPAGRAYFGDLQWERVFTEGPPAGASLPSELRGPTPPQLRDDHADPPPPRPPSVPPLPDPEDFQPGTRADWVTAMGERLLVWLTKDEIHKAGSVYTPGPNYSRWDDRNVRAVQAKMGNTVDPAGEEFFGALQWARLFEEGPPASASVPADLRPGGSSSTGGDNIPVANPDITLHYGVEGDWAAGYHTGVDFGDRGSDVIRSVASGTVVSTGSAGDWGRRVVVRHSNGRYSWYCHLRTIDVSKGQSVSRGTRVGLMGETGRTFGKHLHYQESTGGYAYRDEKRPEMLGIGRY